MALDTETVRRIAHLARLGVDESEFERYARDLSSILDLVAQLERADTGDVEPLAHPLDVTQRLREDEVTEVDQRDKFQAIAPRTERGLYLVPRVIE